MCCSSCCFFFSSSSSNSQWWRLMLLEDRNKISVDSDCKDPTAHELLRGNNWDAPRQTLIYYYWFLVKCVPPSTTTLRMCAYIKHISTTMFILLRYVKKKKTNIFSLLPPVSSYPTFKENQRLAAVICFYRYCFLSVFGIANTFCNMLQCP